MTLTRFVLLLTGLLGSLTSGCWGSGACGEFPGPCLFPTGGGGGWHAREPSRREQRSKRQQDARRRFLEGAACVCADPLCSARHAAEKWCKGDAHCLRDLSDLAPRGYVAVRDNPRRFERHDEVLDAQGQLHAVLLNDVPVSIRWFDGYLSVKARGRDAGSRPFYWRLRVTSGGSSDLSIGGVSYACR